MVMNWSTQVAAFGGDRLLDWSTLSGGWKMRDMRPLGRLKRALSTAEAPGLASLVAYPWPPSKYTVMTLLSFAAWGWKACTLDFAAAPEAPAGRQVSSRLRVKLPQNGHKTLRRPQKALQEGTGRQVSSGLGVGTPQSGRITDSARASERNLFRGDT